MSDGFDKDLRDHLHREAARANDLPSGLPSRIRRGMDSGGRFTPIQQLALVATMVIFVAAVGFLIVQLKGARGSQPADSGFACANRSGGNQSALSNLQIVRVTAEGGFDRVTFEFNGPVPGYRVDNVDSIAPTEGSGFFHVSLRNISSPAAGIVTPVDPGPRLVTEVRQLTAPDEWTVFGISLSSPTCNRVSQLENPTRLVIDFPTLATFTCNTVAGGDQRGGPFTLTGIGVQPAGNAETGFYDHVALSFDSGVPPYAVIPQSSATFTRYDGSTVTLLGSSGIRVKLGNVRNTDLSKIGWSMAGSEPSPAKTGPTDFTPNLPQIKEIAVLDNSQGTIQFGIGLASAACMRVIDQGKTLVIDVKSPVPVAQVPLEVREFSFPDALHGWAVGTASKGQTTYHILARTTDGGATWHYLPFQDPSIANAVGTSWHILFADAQVGWLYGPHLYVTHDGGTTWAAPQSGPVSVGLPPLLALSVSGDSGWAVTAVQECTAPAGSCPPVLLVSSDGGRGWTVAAQQPRIVGRLAQMVRVSHDIGWILSWRHYAASDNSSLAVTHDSGVTWQTLTTPCPPVTSFEDRMAAIDDRTVWIVCGSQPGAGSQQMQLITSTDGGLQWSHHPNPRASGYVQSLALSGPTSGLVGWLAFARGPLYITSDGGRTWRPANLVGTQLGQAGSGVIEVTFADALHGWAATSTEIFRTSDGGLHWTGVPTEAIEEDVPIYTQTVP
jgi:photosystem II stability/assembly factor-like uncharacterized protein